MYISLDSPFGSPLDRPVGGQPHHPQYQQGEHQAGLLGTYTLKALGEDIFLSQLSYWNVSLDHLLEPEAQGNQSHLCYLILLKIFYFVHHVLFGVNFYF